MNSWLNKRKKKMLKKMTQNIHYMFMGCGSEENFGTEKMAQQLKELGINSML